MRNQRFNLITAATLGLAGLGFTGCEANVHDNTADIHDNKVDVDANLDFKVDANVDVDKVEPGQSVSVTMNATGVVLVDPETDPPAADADKAAYFQIYLDDTDADPILVTASASASVKIPADVEAGDHKLICQLRKHDGSKTEKQQEISIKVAASASATVGTAGSGASM